MRIQYFLSLCSCLSLAASSNALASKWLSPKTYSSYEDAKKEFHEKKLYEKLDFNGAKKWFKKRNFADEFDNYFDARDFFEKKGYLKPVSKFYDGSGQYSFVRDGEEVNKNVLHDVIVTLFLSDFVYTLGRFRKQTKVLGFTKKELKTEVAVGDSFDERNFTPEQMMIAKSKGKKFDPKGPIVKLMSGNLKVSKDPNSRTPEVNMAQFQDILKHKDYAYASKRFANELTVTALHSFKTNKLFIYKFDAKYNDKNLVYSIAGRERKNGQNLGEKETDLYLSFRGSTTSLDWLTNFKAPFAEVLLRHDEKSGKCYLVEQKTHQKIEIEKALHDKFKEVVKETGEEIMIHQGFLGYLFDDRGRDGNIDADKENDSMYTNIRLNVWRLLENKNMESNTLYVTGHSLGAALSVVASFFLASDKEINNRSKWRGVKNVSFAAPHAGNVSFQRALEILQSKENHQAAKTTNGKSLFTGIHVKNNRDIVPLVPFLSRYRPPSGISVHLNRPSMLSLGRPRKPKVELRTVANRKKPWKFLHPTSLMAGLFATTLKFLGCVNTTVPFLLVLPYLMMKPFKNILPPFADFINGVGLFQHTVFGNVGSFIQNSLKIPGVQAGIVVLAWLSLGHLFTKKETSFKERVFLVGLGLPLVASLTKMFANYQYYLHFAKYWEVNFLVGVAIAQLIAIIFRKPSDVVLGKTHALLYYYFHLRPHHQLLSSSEAIMDHVGNDLFEE